ncbi:tyrosine-type recombinase/integrase [Streptomyces natalensis]|uniref:Integrase n=1 Tax=Streptomyces natalensis ATCC 27448 TaxID=1240678 RepID=A0A0D7CQZ0_9ACTN|nr:site-specific integrase [Streptomyces natalensis]KIZ18643.1 integrase [Streptomyces natalensis ATCC 27448]
MAGHIQDRWYKTETDADGKTVRVKSDRHGIGMRYRARYVGPDGTEKSQSFPDGKKRLAENWLTKIKADMDGGRYVDPKAGRTTFRQYAEKWLTAQTTDPTTREPVSVQIRRHAIPYLGTRPLGSFKPEHIREWLGELERALPASSYRRVIFASVSAVFTAAVEDDYLHRNPCKASSVKAPAPGGQRVVPWTGTRTFAVRAALPEEYRAMVDLGAGCGLRQGEIFGLPEGEIGFDTGWLHVVNQVKVVEGKLVFARPKRDKERDVPLSDRVAHILKQHIEAHPPVSVTLPWQRPDGPLVTKRLLFTRADDGPIRRTDFNTRLWKPALVAANVIPKPKAGDRHQAAREHGMHALRHFYASVLLDAGESIKALSAYLGHTDPGFTLRVYTHLLPSSEGRTRRAVDSVYQGMDSAPHGPETAQS